VQARELAHRALAAARKHEERRHVCAPPARRREPTDSVTGAGYYAEALAQARALGMQPLVAQCRSRLGRGVR
jgi:hypothetical protein